jgi:DNA-binding CsgD family transcriptional regulator
MATLQSTEQFPKADTANLAPDVNGDNPLSEREMEVARLLATGLSNAEIARQLVISPHTVKVHLRNIFEKLQVNSRTEASMVLLQHGWLIVPGVEMAPLAGEKEASPPEPEPLSDLSARLQPWQRLYFIAAVLLCILALVTPHLRARGPNSPELLSDAGKIAVGKPAPQIYPRWQAGAPLTVARDRLALARAGEKFYAIGGEGAGGQTLANVNAYDLLVNEWQVRQPLPEPLANLAAAALGDHIYVAGGSQNTADGATIVRDLFLRYEPATDHWEELGILPMPLAGAQLVADETALYLLGGWDGRQMHDEVWRYAPAGDRSARPNWELVTRLDPPRAFLGATIVDGEIYVVGGYDGKSEMDLASAYILATGAWRDLPPLRTPRSGFSLVHDGLAIFALGGGWTRTVDTHERFDPAVGVWSNFPSPLFGEWRHLAAISYDDRIHILGGWSGDYLDIHLRYQSSFRTLLPVITND